MGLADRVALLDGPDQGDLLALRTCRGEPGPVPADVDVLVVGTDDPDDLDEIARAAQHRLGRPVDIRRIRPAAWASPDPADPFLASVRERPLVSFMCPDRT